MRYQLRSVSNRDLYRVLYCPYGLPIAYWSRSHAQRASHLPQRSPSVEPAAQVPEVAGAERSLIAFDVDKTVLGAIHRHPIGNQ